MIFKHCVKVFTSCAEMMLFCKSRAESKKMIRILLDEQNIISAFPPFQRLTQKIFIFSTWNLVKTVLSPFSQCLKITEKVSFNIASVASYDYIFIKNPKNGQFGEFLKCDIFCDFQTLCDDGAAQIKKKSFRINRKVVWQSFVWSNKIF